MEFGLRGALTWNKRRLAAQFSRERRAGVGDGRRRGEQGSRFHSGGDMGIRFYCPSGHKLNVKTFLAGKRGICPHCGARFRIPKESLAGEAVPTAMPVADGEDDAAPPRRAKGRRPRLWRFRPMRRRESAPAPGLAAATAMASGRGAPPAPVATAPVASVAAAAPIAPRATTPQIAAAAGPSPVVGAALHPTAATRPTGPAPFAAAPMARAPGVVVMPAAARAIHWLRHLRPCGTCVRRPADNLVRRPLP